MVTEEKNIKRIAIDGKNKVFGRIASVAAKYSLLGYNVDIYNCDEIVVSGRKKGVLDEYKAWYDTKDTRKGHFVSRMPHMLVRRMIRNMVPHKQERGREAFKRIMCYRGNPETETTFMNIPNSNASDLKVPKYVTIKRICEQLGAKV